MSVKVVISQNTLKGNIPSFVFVGRFKQSLMMNHLLVNALFKPLNIEWFFFTTENDSEATESALLPPPRCGCFLGIFSILFQ
ncbi:hypothetical protein AYY19_04110 [Photobacterium aquimaris]|nr:hypothetical protein AYY19_04110 [Photobacterium aquimaris]PSW02244.1 hypothetical protein CTM91_03960 [Photobacterium aquimaris]